MKKIGLLCIVLCLGAVWAFAKDGEGLVKEKCTVCHDISRIKAGFGVKDKAAWTAVVEKMLSKPGAPTVSHEEHGMILDWLAAQKK